MTEQNPELEVSDTEGRIDRKIKDRILESREAIDEAEQELFLSIGETQFDDKRVYYKARRQLADQWGILVRQYVRNVKPLLTSDNVPNSDYYWNEVPIYKTKVIPPNERDYKWSKFADENANDIRIIRDMGLGPEFEPPKPKEFDIIGLEELMRKQKEAATWSFELRPGAVPPESDLRRLKVDRPLPKLAYENAVEATDDFLDQAGVGLSMSEGEPSDGFLDL